LITILLRFLIFLKGAFNLTEKAWNRWKGFWSKLLKVLFSALIFFRAIIIKVILRKVLRIMREELICLCQCVLSALNHRCIKLDPVLIHTCNLLEGFFADLAHFFLLNVPLILCTNLGQIHILSLFFIFIVGISKGLVLILPWFSNKKMSGKLERMTSWSQL
jgi:hypothetical protein